jgi:hypothetical protein
MTDTDKWKKPFIKSLPIEYKVFWLFLLDECDHAGIWHIEMSVVEARLGIKLSLQKIRGLFKEKVVEFDSGNKLFVPDFVQFQYGILNRENKAHRSVINILERYNLMGLVSPSERAKDKDKELDKDKDTDMVGGIFSIEHCAFLALRDERFVRANKTDADQLKVFNEFLESTAVYERDILDYKKHYAHWRKKQPKSVVPKVSEPADPSNTW